MSDKRPSMVKLRIFSLRKMIVPLSAGCSSKSFETVVLQPSAPITARRRRRWCCANYNGTVGIGRTSSQQTDQWQQIRERVTKNTLNHSFKKRAVVPPRLCRREQHNNPLPKTKYTSQWEFCELWGRIRISHFIYFNPAQLRSCSTHSTNKHRNHLRRAAALSNAVFARWLMVIPGWQCDLKNVAYTFSWQYLLKKKPSARFVTIIFICSQYYLKL